MGSVTLMQQSDIISAKQYMESIHQNDFTGHDIAHVYHALLNQSLKMKVLMIL